MNTKKEKPGMKAVWAVMLSAITGFANAEPVSLTTELSCDFPWVGEEAVALEIQTDLPRQLPDFDNPDGAEARMEVTLSSNLRYWWRLFGAREISMVADIWEADGGIAIGILTSANVAVPSDSGPMVAEVDGRLFEGIFDFAIERPWPVRVGRVAMGFTAWKSDGEELSGSLGDFDVDCEINGGNQPLLHTFEPQALALSETYISFGTQSPGEITQKSVSLTNSTGVPQTITEIVLQGPDSEIFTLSHNCSTLAAGESCTLTLHAAPQTLGEYDATLVISAHDGSQNRTVEGKLSVSAKAVGEPRLIPHPGDSVMEGVPVGVTVAQKIGLELQRGTSLTNSGQLSASISGPDAEAFSHEFTCDTINYATNAPYCYVFVDYQPSEAGQDQAVLTIEAAEASVPAVDIPLYGSGSVTGEYTQPFWMQRVGGRDLYEGYMDAIAGSLVAHIPAPGTRARLDWTWGKIHSSMPLAFSYSLDTAYEIDVLEPLTGEINDGRFSGSMTAYIRSPKSQLTRPAPFNPILLRETVSRFEHANCRTENPVTIQIESAPGETFSWKRGGRLVSRFTMGRMENCGFYTYRHNSMHEGQTTQQPWDIRLE